MEGNILKKGKNNNWVTKIILSDVACGNKKPEYQTDNLVVFLLLKWKHFRSAKKKWEKGWTAKK